MSKYISTLFFILFIPLYTFAIESIGILTNEENLDNSISHSAIEDCVQLLQKACNCTVEINKADAEILIMLPYIDEMEAKKKNRFAQKVSYPYLSLPKQDYSWQSIRDQEQIVLTLATESFQGISFGLYGLLQEQLWFKFYHARETFIPKLSYWPITEEFNWDARARFDKRGFHLHTMHPIELTEALLNEHKAGGIEKIKEYIDWLARNQQNYFEFNLLNSVELDTWTDYIRPAIEYAQSRGILTGIDISMDMIQQKAFKLYKKFPFTLKSKRSQIDSNLTTLFKVPWDVVSIEFSSSEYTTGNLEKKTALRLYITEQIHQKYGAKVMGRTHVVKKEDMLKKSKKQAQSLSEKEQKIDDHRGELVHTVMFYDLEDHEAPVYHNVNFQYMKDKMLAFNKERETWYYPESAYWVSFDNSIPMLLMPYLEARLNDIKLADSLGINGHLTFSSGWEWGYWMIDWSIARWSWEHDFLDYSLENSPYQYMHEFFEDGKVASLFERANSLQEEYIKNKQLIRYMAASITSDEMPKPFNKQFQPRPDHKYRWMRYKAKAYDIAILRSNAVEPMLLFSAKTDSILATLDQYQDSLTWTAQQKKVYKELFNGLKITGLRAKHRAMTLDAILIKRELKLNVDASNFTTSVRDLMRIANQTKSLAQEIVTEQEKTYRYDIKEIGRRYENKKSTTAYSYGYLYPVSNLHFWEREEQQVLKDRYHPFFMNIWELFRILGVKK